MGDLRCSTGGGGGCGSGGTSSPVQSHMARRQGKGKRGATKVQHVSFEYFTSRGCSTNRGEEVNWVTTIPNSPFLYPICYLGPYERNTPC